MFELHDVETGALVGRIDQTQLQFLIDHLEETDSGDQDYYLDEGTVDMLEDEGCDADLLRLLRAAVGEQDGVEVRWSASE